MNYINGGSGTYNKPTSVVASGSITQANNRGDYTATNAFYWANGLDLSAYQDGRHFLTIYDSGGLGAGGFISATAPVGDGGGNELLGAELLDDPTFDDTSKWVKGDASITISGGQAIWASTPRYLSLYQVGKALISGNGVLYKSTITNVSIANTFRRYAGGTYFPNTLPMGTTTSFLTSGGSNQTISVVNYDAIATGTIDGYSMKQVTDPPPTGVRIISTKGGATRAWTWKNASFNPNTACSYTITYVGN